MDLNNENLIKKKTPITQEKIFKIMLTLAIIISSVFFLKNLFGGAVSHAFLIGGTLISFAIVFVILNTIKAKETTGCHKEHPMLRLQILASEN